VLEKIDVEFLKLTEIIPVGVGKISEA